MRSTVLRSGLPTLLVAVLAMLGLGAAAPPHSSAAGKRARGPAIVVKTAHRTRGAIVLHVKARRDLRSAVVRLDGHRVDSEPPRRRGERKVIVLDHGDGVHFGRNRIAVKVRTRAGGRARVRDVVTVRRDAPLPAIERPRRIVARDAVRLDGRKTLAAHGGKLSFHWEVVGAPVGARASLRGADGPRPRLIASAPGDYRVALTVNEKGKKAQAATASSVGSEPACTVPAMQLTSAPIQTGPIGSTPLAKLPKGALTVVRGDQAATSEPSPEPRAVPGCATTVKEVQVESNFAPIGAEVNTRAEYEGTNGIRVGDSFFPYPPNEDGEALFVLLNANTLNVIATDTPVLDASHRYLSLELVQRQAPAEEVLVVSGALAGCCSLHEFDPGTGFSAIETFSHGEERQQPIENDGPPLNPIHEIEGYFYGQLAGWLRPGIPLDDETPLYAFVNPERFAFNTQSASSPTSNTISVASGEFPATLPAGASAGFEVLALGPDRAPELGTPIAFGTNSSTPGAGQAAEEEMTALLKSAGPEQTVIVQSIGDPDPATSATTALGQAMGKMGASRWVFFELDGGGGYAFVGNGFGQFRSEYQPVRSEVAETSEASVHSVDNQAVGGGSLRGLLTRNAESALSPDLADSLEKPGSEQPNYELDQVTYQPGVAWPLSESPGDIAATRYLAEALRLNPSAGGTCYKTEVPDFRSAYCNTNLHIGNLLEELTAQRYPAGENVAFTEGEFEAVKEQLKKELRDVAEVREMITALEKPLGSQEPSVEAQKIAGDVLEALPPGTAGNATAAKLGIANSILHAASNTPEVGEALGAIAAVLGIAGEIAQENGAFAPDWRIQTEADKIGATVKSRLSLMSAGLGTVEDILVSDWGKLSTAAADARERWGATPVELARQASALRLGINQWMWKAILPGAYELVAFPETERGSQEGYWCMYDKHYPKHWYPWKGAPASSVFYPLSGHQGDNFITPGGYAMLAGSYTDPSSLHVGQELDEKIFDRPGTGAGLTQPELFEEADWTIAHPGMIEYESQEHVGNCSAQ